MTYDYRRDRFGHLCLMQAQQSKAHAGFGAVLVSDNQIIAAARNRRSQPTDRLWLEDGIDYATHAEEAAIIAALEASHSMRNLQMYVLGMAQRGAEKGRLSVRASNADQQYSCQRCARRLVHFGIPIHIPLPSGWLQLSPAEALSGAQAFRAAGRHRQFITPPRT